VSEANFTAATNPTDGLVIIYQSNSSCFAYGDYAPAFSSSVCNIAESGWTGAGTKTKIQVSTVQGNYCYKDIQYWYVSCYVDGSGNIYFQKRCAMWFPDKPADFAIRVLQW